MKGLITFFYSRVKSIDQARASFFFYLWPNI